MSRNNNFQELIYGIFALVILGVFSKVILSDLNTQTSLDGIITIAVFLGIFGAIIAIIKKFVDMIN